MNAAAGGEGDTDRAPSQAREGEPVDASRRQFFRRFAGEVITTAAQVASVVGDLRDRSAAEASVLLGTSPESAAAPSAPASTAAAGEPTGFRTAFRFQSDDVLLVIDQRELPGAIVELPVRTAIEAGSLIRNLAVRGAPATGQVAALGMALSARVVAGAKPANRRAILENAAVVLKNARPTTASLGWAVDRVMTRYRTIGALSEDGDAIARAMLDEAMAIVAESTDDHGRLAEVGLELLPTRGDEPVRILTHASTGALASGQFGTALGLVQAAQAREIPLHVWVPETRPGLVGARLAAWELKQRGVAHTILPDMAVGPLLARGEVDIVLVGAERVVANGDTAADLGTSTIAVLAARHGVPFVVCAPLSSVDLPTRDGAGIPMEERPAAELTMLRGQRLAPEDAQVLNPAFDVTPAALISAIVTDEGILRPPYGPALAGAAERRVARRDAVIAARLAASA